MPAMTRSCAFAAALALGASCGGRQMLDPPATTGAAASASGAAGRTGGAGTSGGAGETGVAGAPGAAGTSGVAERAGAGCRFHRSHTGATDILDDL